MRKKWLKTEDIYLIEEYAKSKKSEIIKHLNRSWPSIQTRASKLGLKRMETEIVGKVAKLWDDESVSYLIKNYEKTEKSVIEKELNRTWSSIQNKAFLLKLKREIANANASNLINGSYEAFYWLGFIMADGHFNSNKQLQINLAKKDLNHLKKFASFVEYTNELTKPSINIDYTNINDWLVSTFKISNIKTYNACDLTKLEHNELFCFCIGFIDGDGCISINGNLTIKCHKSWLENLNIIISSLTNGDYNESIINAEGLAFIQLSKIEHLKRIKQKALDLSLPILERKWMRVKNSKLSKKERGIKNMNECRELFNKGISVKEIIKITGLSKTQIYKQKQIYEKENY